MRSTSLLVLAAAAALALGCGSGSGGTGTGGAGGTGGTGGSTGAGGHGGTGSGGQGGAGGACAVCAAADHPTLCPSDVANASMCPSQGATCCDANDVQWQCGLCAAETCHWFKYCPTTGTGGAGGQGGAGATCAQLASDYASAFLQARTCNASVSTAQCTHLAISSLTCDCQGWVSDTSQLDPILAQWNAAGCTSELCPAACASPGTSGACIGIDSGDVCTAAN